MRMMVGEDGKVRVGISVKGSETDGGSVLGKWNGRWEGESEWY